MYSKYLSAYKEQTQQFFNQLKIAEKTYDIEAIHEMRVAVKKLRSLSKMFKVIFPDSFNTKICFKYLRKIFKSASDIRDSHVMTGLVNQYKSDKSDYSDLCLYFTNLEKNGINVFKKVVALNRKHAYITIFESIENLNKKVVDASTDTKIYLYIKKKISDLSELLRIATNDKSIHKLRIRLKELNFILDVQNDDEKKQTVSGLKNIASDLGRWHDKIILIRHTGIIKVKITNNKNLSDYIHLQNILFSENKNETEKILNRLKKELLFLTHNFY